MHVAICGEILQHPINASALCACASRLFKYLIPFYYEEFAIGLKDYLRDQCVVVGDPGLLSQESHLSHVATMRVLYGDRTLPDDITELFNVALEVPHHSPGQDADLPAVRGYFLSALKRCHAKIQNLEFTPDYDRSKSLKGA